MLGRFSKCLSAIFAVGIIASNIPAHTVYAQDDTPDFSYIGAASSFSAEQTAEMARTVYKGLKEHKDTIKLQVDGVSMVIEPNHEAAAGICREVAQNYDVGLMTNAVSINYKLCSYGSESYIEYTPNYVVEDAYYNTAYAKAMSVLDDITAMVDMGWSDYEKALFLHDYLAAYCDYDHDLEKYTAYDMVTTKDAVCDGYSALYSMLMNRVGVRTTKVISRTLNHAWNLVDIEGELYHVDVTFDDSFHYGHPGLVSHDFFLKTNDEMNGSRHEADDYQFLYGKSVYDSVSVSPVIGFWENTSCAISPIVINGDSSDVMWAVISDDGVNSVAVNLCDMDSIGDDDIDYIGLYAQNSIWNVPGSRSYYPGNHSAALVRDNVLFYTTSDEIYGLYNGKAVSLYKLTDEQKQAGRLYGLFEKDGDLYYYVSPAYAPDSAHGTAYATSKEYRLSGYTVERFVEYVKNQTGESTVTIATYGDNTVQEVCPVYSNYSLPTTPTRDGFLFKELYYDEALTAGNEVGDVLLTHDEMFYADWYRCGMAGAKGSIFDNFNLSLYMAYDDALMYGSGNYLKMRVNSTSETINFEDIENNKDDNFGGYYFADVQFPPKDMEKLIGIETFIDGVSCGVQTYSVNDYFNDIINSGSRRYDPYRGLAQAALTYGACANAYFDSDSSNVTEQMRSSLETADIDPPAGADYDAVVQMNEVEGVIYMGSSLLLKSSTSIRHYFGIEQGRSVDDFVFMVDGETVYPTFSKTQVTGGITYDVYFVDITDISADALITKHTFELSDAVNSDMIDISVCGYAYQKVISMGETSDDYKNLLTSLILYAKEAWQFA